MLGLFYCSIFILKGNMKKNILKENMQRFGTKNLNESTDTLDLIQRAEDVVQNLRRNMSTNSVLQQTEKMGYLKAYDELLDILSDIGYQIEIE